MIKIDKAIVICIFFFLFITLVACVDDEMPAKELGPFNSISSNGNVTFVLVQGVENRVISTSLNDASYNVNNEQLSINAAGGSMTIAVNDLDLLWCNTCDVKNSGALILDTLNLYVHAGSVELNDLQITNMLKLDAVNTGSYKLSGMASFLKLSIVNSTRFDGYGLITDSTHVNSLNALDAEVYAKEVLDVVISSAGNVNYKGDPKTVRVSASGTGQAVKK